MFFIICLLPATAPPRSLHDAAEWQAVGHVQPYLAVAQDVLPEQRGNTPYFAGVSPSAHFGSVRTSCSMK
ncbi:hypothetical protein ACWEJ6_47745 [Nonomuraea sp. NPDC004702]